MMNKKYKAGLLFGILMFVTLFLQGLYFRPDHSGTGILKTLLSAVIGAGVGGLLYGWLMNKFSTSKMVTNSTKIETAPGEVIVFEGAANHFKGIEGVSGKLYLTDKKLVFKSHKLNIQNHELSIILRDIQKAGGFKPLNITDNGLLIDMSDGSTEKFVVENRDKWITTINGSLQKKHYVK